MNTGQPISELELEQQIDAAAASIRQRWSSTPRFGIVLGTGAGRLAEAIEAEVTLPYHEVPHFPVSTALGHKGQFVLGTLDGQPVIAMQGRFHLYEGYPVDQATLPIHVMHRLGVEILFISNASGGINPKFASGDIMLIDSHIDLMWRTTIHLSPSTTCQRPSFLSDRAYDSALIELATQAARRHDFPVHRGAYGALLGPNYETRAEYRFLRQIGADVAGMSTVPEVAVAAKRGLRVLGLSVVTNVAKPDVLEATSGQEVIDAAEVAAPRLESIVVDVMNAVGMQPG